MVDHDPLEELRPHSAQADDVLDSLTQELKIELARAERERVVNDSVALHCAKRALDQWLR